MANEQHIKFDINELAEGGAREQIDREIRKIMANIMDVNTDIKKKRALTIKVEFEPDANRQTVTTHISVKSSLAPQISIGTTMMVGRDSETGMVQAAELRSTIPGQTFFDPQDSTLKTDIGESIEDLEGSSIVDFNKRKANK